ncbi:MAG: hypothetical protein H8D96_14065 [Desulfobacterales bacterium]|uniref:Uncharacterized protein n=1 Tax=Candidatus Desulfatibia vada TaxID=2841696 RepID=A0A8J6NV42_9BACT|nr:hypothetical protein [Candidatus Desulfatibia vada]
MKNALKNGGQGDIKISEASLTPRGLHGEGSFQTFAEDELPSLSFFIICHPKRDVPFTPFLPLSCKKKATKHCTRPWVMAFVACSDNFLILERFIFCYRNFLLRVASISI